MSDLCVSCGKAFGRSAKPRPAFDHEGRPVGSIHGTCAVVDLRRDKLLFPPRQCDPLAARFYVWCWHLRPPSLRASDEWYAEMLLTTDGPPSETLDEKQRSRLAWWRAGPLRMGDARAARIEAAYAALVREFQDWVTTPEAE